MADRILSVQTLTIGVGSTAEISIPKITERAGKTFTDHWPTDSVTYEFDGSNSGIIELVQDSGDTEGIKIPAATVRQSGPWRLIAGPPKYVYSSAGDTVRVTVVLVR